MLQIIKNIGKYLPGFFLVFTIFLPVVCSVRPSYNFCPCVFDELPDYPDDLLEIRDLFIQNKINATQISPSYYLQPEFYSSWFSVCDIFYNESRSHYGIYGFNIYPSHYTIFTEKNNTVYITAFLNNNFGIGVKTGVSINMTYDSSLNVEQLKPEKSYLLLNETYPRFKNDWAIPLTLKIDVLENRNATVMIYANKPPEEIHQQWKDEYGLKYATVERLNSKVPQLTIKIFTPEEKITAQQVKNTLNPIYLVVVFFVVLILVIILIMFGAYKKWKEEQSSLL